TCTTPPIPWCARWQNAGSSDLSQQSKIENRNSVMDPILFQVILNALIEATEEMTVSLKRSAYSTNIKTRADFSCAFFDRELRTVAQASGQPVHLGSLSHFVPSVI